MPTILTQKDINELSFISKKEGQSVISRSDNFISIKTYVVKPITIKRSKPLDLFANVTARFVQSATGSVDARLSRYSLDGSNYTWVREPANFGIYMETYALPSAPSFAGLKTKALLKIKDEKINLAISIGTIGQTVDMVADLARDMFKTFHRIRSGRAIGDFINLLQTPTRKGSKRAANAWLQYTYGITPLLSDIYGLSEEIAKEIISGRYITVEVKEKFESRQFSTTNTTSTETLVEGLQKLTARYMVDSKALKSLAENGFTNPAAIIWDTLPYSFVVDWVVGVGDYLNSLDALVGVKNLTYYTSTGYTYRVEQTRWLAPSSIWKIIDTEKTTVVKKVRDRSALKGGLSPTYPQYNPGLGISRLTSALALIRGRFK